jgi:hypothetical protein
VTLAIRPGFSNTAASTTWVISERSWMPARVGVGIAQVQREVAERRASPDKPRVFMRDLADLHLRHPLRRHQALDHLLRFEAAPPHRTE